MPSVKNPNCPSRNRLAARAATAKKARRKSSALAQNKISKRDMQRGARPGLLPSSGPRAKMSAKKAKKVEKKMGYALKRRLDADGEKEMQDAPDLEAQSEQRIRGEGEMEIEQQVLAV